MQKSEFIQEYLKIKGVSERLVRPYPCWLASIPGKQYRPRLFESPWKLFLWQSVLGTVSWGVIMFLSVWQLQGITLGQCYSSLFFGVATGLLLALDVFSAKKKFGITNWEQWLEDNQLKY
ncbi:MULTISPECIES: DUF6404 family protein [Vibrio]|uniref:Uncharacterized protein n=1 Tax=Vibrio proteolyticus NBRC 13287 TaxID=1219065 RepID=U2ZGI2_VIBPR|nr:MULTISPECIES: DUF6404 family protein [Vibrio]NAW55850.1 hypothetical protein [Vibrio sp. V36_P2S2PM302]NAX23577.1 hypothetical protein [Vibrio sp. V39_P1S14PM300]NAX27795.1 hypothetical protein [Vibrio sp. V38_P2S17PM301]NAX32935.1 hypothetical protein [Vibrio sp. V37_P2S8PM304]GAD66781.1 hypothetical protein VPR01S_05_00760 [Vibrio proteolyticus NBRC 13287]